MSAATEAVEPMRVTTAAERTGRKPAGQTAGWDGPNKRQRAYIARLCLELLGIPYPTAAETPALIARLKNAAEAARVDGGTDDIPF